MKRITLVLTGLLLIAFTGFSQPVNCDFGTDEGIELPKNNTYQKMVGADEHGFYVLRVDEQNKIWLEFWNGENLMRETNNQLILPSVSGIKAEFKEMFYLDGNLVLFTTVTNESIKQKTLYLQHVNKSGKIIGESEPIGRLTNQNIQVDFNIQLTEDKKNMFVYYHRQFQKYNEEPYFFKIYNPKLEEVINKTVKLPLTDRVFDVIQYRVLKNNDIMMLAKLKQEDKRRRGPEVFDYSILHYNLELKKVSDYPMEVTKYEPQNAIFGVNEKDKWVDVIGFMARRNKSEYVGMYHERLNLETNEWEPIDRKTTYHSFERIEERDFRSLHLYERYDQVYNYKLRDIVYLSTGDPVFISEHVNVWKDSIVDPQTKEVTYNYYYKYNDILTAKIDRENKFEWVSRIPKSQKSYNDFGDYSSYNLSVIGEKIKFYYNDHRKNLKLLKNDFYIPSDLKEINNPGRKGRAVTTTLFSDGKIYGSYMFDDDHKKHTIKPDMLTKYDNDYYIFTRGSSFMGQGNVYFARFYIE